ncbi:MAG: hypothetical protein Q4C87_13000, partial [Actinomycetaceae bacterium]|nr:hypothetical protein [Actinomycetaceae bacterium]
GGASSGAATSAQSGGNTAGAGQSGTEATGSAGSGNKAGAQSAQGAAQSGPASDTAASGGAATGGADVEAVVNIGYVPKGYARATIDMPDRIAFLRPEVEDSGFAVFIPDPGSPMDKYSAEEFLRSKEAGLEMPPESIKAEQGTTVDGIPATAASAVGLTPNGYMGVSVVKTTRNGKSVMIVAQTVGPDEASAAINAEEFSKFVKGVSWK